MEGVDEQWEAARAVCDRIPGAFARPACIVLRDMPEDAAAMGIKPEQRCPNCPLREADGD